MTVYDENNILKAMETFEFDEYIIAKKNANYSYNL